MEEIRTNSSKEPFVFKLEDDDTVYELPPFKRIPFRLVLDALKAKSTEEATVVLVDYIDEKCPGLCDSASVEQMFAVVDLWKASSELVMGES